MFFPGARNYRYDGPMSDILTADQVMDVTEERYPKVLEVRDSQDDGDDPTTLALLIDVTGVSGVDYVYDLVFVPIVELPGTATTGPSMPRLVRRWTWPWVTRADPSWPAPPLTCRATRYRAGW
ncbi:MAG: hypothetical protein Ct9H300mP12_13090 [Acidimicrobiales bacterium]|nr:MAG: hypothetical protein Ct9H300mP12_13090 [Acidimicrobiales bacterium]